MRKFWIVVLLVALVGLLTVAAPVQAALKAFAPPGQVATLNGVSIAGIPAWYQDINGVSVEPCLTVATCGLIGLGDPMFNEALTMSYPGNFPSEAFYTDAVAIFTLAPSPVDAKVILAMEYTFID